MKIESLTNEEIFDLEKRANKLFCFESEDYLSKRKLIRMIRDESLKRFLDKVDKQKVGDGFK